MSLNDWLELIVAVVTILGFVTPIVYPPKLRFVKYRDEKSEKKKIPIIVRRRFPIRSDSGAVLLDLPTVQKVRAADLYGRGMNLLGALFIFSVLAVLWFTANGQGLFTFTCTGYCSGPIDVGLNTATLAVLLIPPLVLELGGAAITGWSKKQKNSPAWAQVIAEEFALRGIPPSRRNPAFMTDEERDLVKRMEEEYDN